MNAQELVTPAAAAFVIAAASAALLSRVQVSIALDRPNDRSLHTRPVPRTGGLAILAGYAIGLALAPWAPSVAVLGALALLVAVSFLDDLRGLPVAVRLACHFAAAAAAALSLPSSGAATVLVVTLVVAWAINAYNFMDGSDGLAGGMAVFGFAAYGWVAAVAGDAGFAAASLSVAAAAGAFLLFNFHPARIFMGDAGSVPLGFLAAALGLSGWERGLWSPWLPLLVFSPFLADATVTLARRVLSGERFWQAHHDHYYQRLIRMGWSHRRTAIAAYAVMAGAGGAAVISVGRGAAQQLGIAAIWIAVLAALLAAIEVKWRRR
jgi:UDP-N-acetylmuramyl pentapeptide phosphotransferase/UDP-N-acetylglucosamine-1-phosphate transferase